MSVSVVVAPEHKVAKFGALKIFLAGGITNCIDWQKIIIDNFEKTNNYNICLFNPRRKNFDIKKDSAEEQIVWEFNAIEKCDLFTMYFDGGVSDQPICLYELGRNIERMKQRFPDDWTDRIVITCDAKYKRVEDVIIQTRLATDDMVKVNVVDDVDKSVHIHYNNICKAIDKLE